MSQIEKIKIAFIDVDGTLLNDKKEVSNYTKQVMKEMIRKGVYIVICSGRANFDTIKISKMISASPIVISDNGASIFHYETNQIIYESAILPSILREIENYAKEEQIGIVYNGTYQRYQNKHLNPNGIMITNAEYLKESITQIVVSMDQEEKMIKMQKWLARNYPELEAKNVWRQLVPNTLFGMDIDNHVNSKGKAVTILLKQLGLEKENAICFGDQMNDLSMFQECGKKVAMKNGNEKLKEIADDITFYTNNEDGVAKFMAKKFLS